MCAVIYHSQPSLDHAHEIFATILQEGEVESGVNAGNATPQQTIGNDHIIGADRNFSRQHASQSSHFNQLQQHAQNYSCKYFCCSSIHINTYP